MAIEGYQDILYLIGLAFGKRDFVEVVDRIGTEDLFAKAPYGDLTADQRETFEAAFRHPVLRQYVALWWSLYDNLRATGELPDTVPWNPDQLEV
jgi:hypothetical protein